MPSVKGEPQPGARVPPQSQQEPGRSNAGSNFYVGPSAEQLYQETIQAMGDTRQAEGSRDAFHYGAAPPQGLSSLNHLWTQPIGGQVPIDYNRQFTMQRAQPPNAGQNVSMFSTMCKGALAHTDWHHWSNVRPCQFCGELYGDCHSAPPPYNYTKCYRCWRT